MNKKILLAEAIFALLLVLAFRYKAEQQYQLPPIITKQQALSKKMIFQCSPDWSQLDVNVLADGIGVLPGWGNYRWNISTKNDSALFYFNQGINLYYAFHIIESMASFKKAERFDDSNPMIYWAQALAYGPNINDFEYAAVSDAYAAAQKALSLSTNAGKKEKALIKAMAVRYSTDSTISRESLNILYTAGMQKAYQQLNNDADIAVLYADAMMLQHPWDYWKHSGQPQPWTPAIVQVLEKTIRQSPEHPGANHYYIHMVEASPTPQKAIASADRLGKLMPSVAHMIHMPSHIYIRTGNYTEGIKVNRMSVKGYNDYLAIYPEVANKVDLYLIHNLHMQTACAMMKSSYAISDISAEDCRKSFDTSFMSLPQPLGNFVQYVYMTPVINDVRFGKWDILLNARTAIPDEYVFANALWHWSRGMAFARTKRIPEAKAELAILEEKMRHPDMQIVMQPFNAPVDAAKVAAKILAGVIAEEENDLPAAIAFFTTAVANEDAMIYNEPKDWLLPARQYLGAALLKAGNYTKAEKILREDLKDNPHNHWSLYGLMIALEKQHKKNAFDAVKKEYRQAFAGNDIGEGYIVY